MAVKYLRSNVDAELKDFERECSILSSCHHENILGFIGAFRFCFFEVRLSLFVSYGTVSF